MSVITGKIVKSIFFFSFSKKEEGAFLRLSLFLEFLPSVLCFSFSSSVGLKLFYLAHLYSERADFSLLLGISTCAGGPVGLDLTSLLLAILVGVSR